VYLNRKETERFWKKLKGFLEAAGDPDAALVSAGNNQDSLTW